MNQHTSLLEYNGKYYNFVNTDLKVQWFVAKGHAAYPNLSLQYILTLGRIWMAEKVLHVEYDMSPENAEQIKKIESTLYETKCHPDFK
jgi:hypothetical protein